MFGFSVGYFIHHPEAPDRMSAGAMSLVLAVIWALSIAIGLRWRRTTKDANLQKSLLGVLIGSAALSVVVLAMEVGGLLA